MIIKRSGKTITGAELTVAERKAMNIEINRQIDISNKANMNEIDALVLWVLHSTFGFGKKRLRKYYENFSKELNGLSKRYEFTDPDLIWLCTQKLKEYGVDIVAWNSEKGEK